MSKIKKDKFACIYFASVFKQFILKTFQNLNVEKVLYVLLRNFYVFKINNSIVKFKNIK